MSCPDKGEICTERQNVLIGFELGSSYSVNWTKLIFNNCKGSLHIRRDEGCKRARGGSNTTMPDLWCNFTAPLRTMKKILNFYLVTLTNSRSGCFFFDSVLIYPETTRSLTWFIGYQKSIVDLMHYSLWEQKRNFTALTSQFNPFCPRNAALERHALSMRAIDQICKISCW